MLDDRNALSPDGLQHRPGSEQSPGPPIHGVEAEPDPQRLLQSLRVSQIELSLQAEELRRALAELEADRARYAARYDHAPVGDCTLSCDGRIREANLTLAGMLGVARSELLQQSIHDFVPDTGRDALKRHLQRTFATEETQACDLRVTKPNGTEFWVRLHSVRMQAADGGALCRTTFSDITDSRRAEKALRRQREFFRQIAENLSDFIAVLDRDGRRIYNSPSYEQFFGAAGKLRNTDSFAEVHPDDQERIRQVFRQTVQTGQGQQVEFRFVMGDGSIRHMESRGSAIRDGEGRVARVLVVSQDVTERKLLQEQVRRMAFHDALTGLPNRHLLADRLRQAIAMNARTAHYGALMFLDLDHFKPLNDTHGHDAGDLLLIEAADRLKRCLREMDTVARFGGDEFVVMLGQLDPDRSESVTHARSIAEKLLAALSGPYHLAIPRTMNADASIEHRCTASIGVTLFGNREEHPGEILKNADLAMYRAKQAGGNRIRFDPGIE